MPDNSSRPYQVVYSERLRRIVRALGERAARRGLREAYLGAIKSMHHHLTMNPLTWGDPQNRLHHLGLLVLHRVQGRLRVNYAVDEQRRIVYLRTINPMPGQGLDDEA